MGAAFRSLQRGGILAFLRGVSGLLARVGRQERPGWRSRTPSRRGKLADEDLSLPPGAYAVGALKPDGPAGVDLRAIGGPAVDLRAGLSRCSPSAPGTVPISLWERQ